MKTNNLSDFLERKLWLINQSTITVDNSDGTAKVKAAITRFNELTDVIEFENISVNPQDVKIAMPAAFQKKQRIFHPSRE